jgi:UDP-N-acetylglucosamine--N-acetylmuramyl-(pentapeptide) pyrophosphoryl-undecaprenol N-acetylglucosamine transferase
MRILIAAGGTGGHIYPALAVLQRLAARSADLEVRWLGGHRGLESTVVPRAGHRLDRLALRTLRTVDVSVAAAMDPLRLAVSVPQATWKLGRWRPDVVFTTGGYVAIPALSAAAALRVPSLMWEGNRLAGRSVRATARLASALACSFAGTATELPGRTYVTGTPIRSFAGVDRAAARASLGLPPDDPVVMVFGGSQAVRRLNDAVADALPRIADRVAVLHVTGETAHAEALRHREALPAAQRERYRVFPFLGDEMAGALVAADLLVGRAGSSTLAEAAAVGLPLVVVPYPHAAAHQAANARELQEAGAALLIADEAFDGRALEEACDILADEPRRAAMAAASRALGRPGAADATADLLTALAARGPLPDAASIERQTREVPT